MKKIITVIDLGSNMIAGAVGGIGPNGTFDVVFLESIKSRGVNEGDISDLPKAVEDISRVIKKLESQARRKLKNISVSIRGSDVKLEGARGMIPLSRVSREITRRDVKRCIDIAGMIKIPMGRAIVQRMVKDFVIDEGSRVTNPVGLYGMKLEVESLIATANRSKVQTISKSIDLSGLLLDGFYLSSAASAASVLDREEKEKGVLLLDVGDSLTEGLTFRKGILEEHYKARRGARHFKDSVGHAHPGKLHDLFEAMDPLLQRKQGAFHSCVITGGGALVDGMIEETEKALGLPCRIGLVRNSRIKLNSQDAIIHASTIGLIGQLAQNFVSAQPQGGSLKKTLHRLLDLYEHYF